MLCSLQASMQPASLLSLPATVLADRAMACGLETSCQPHRPPAQAQAQLAAAVHAEARAAAEQGKLLQRRATLAAQAAAARRAALIRLYDGSRALGRRLAAVAPAMRGARCRAVEVC